MKMFKFFFIITLCFSILVWFLHEQHNSKFLEFVQLVPYSSLLINKIHLYLYTSAPKIKLGISKTKVFTTDELKEYNGEKESKGIYIAILGEVFDVEKGRKHYGPGGSYHVFAGRDASRSFITGDFNDPQDADHVLDLSLSELLSLKDWLKFYKKEYVLKGRVVGRYYNEEGKKTKYWEELQEKLKQAEMNEKTKSNDEHIFPPCNVEWNAESGTKVWCSNKSGGIERNWIGMPQKLYIVGSESYRCACVNFNEIQKDDSPQYTRRGHLKQYENCDPLQYACFIKE